MGKIHYLYLITRSDSKEYVGVSTNPDVRLSAHKTGKGSKYLKNRADLTLNILACGEKDYIYNLEYEFIKLHKPELNIAAGGKGGFGDQVGIRNKQAKLTDNQILEIRNLAFNNSEISYTEIANMYGIVRETVGNICRHSRWAHVGGPKIINRYDETQNLANKPYIRQLFDEGKSIDYIVDDTGSCRSTVYNTLKKSGINFSEINKIKLEYLISQCKELKAQGAMIKDIVTKLGISAPTVRKYLKKGI